MSDKFLDFCHLRSGYIPISYLFLFRTLLLPIVDILICVKHKPKTIVSRRRKIRVRIVKKDDNGKEEGCPHALATSILN